MNYLYWLRFRIKRLIVIAIAVALYIVLFTLDAVSYFSYHATASSSLFLLQLQFGFSSFVALSFIAVGSLVWLYARNRMVAMILFCFTLTLMVSFVTQTAATLNDPWLSAIADVGTTLSLPLFSILLLLFPKNKLSLKFDSTSESAKKRKISRKFTSAFLLRGYLIVLLLLSILVAPIYASYYLLNLDAPPWLQIIYFCYYLVAITGILVTIVVSYRQTATIRERQQLRLFVGGVIIACAPVLLLTILPSVFLPEYALDGQVSAISFVLLPLALGYSILRYQILVFDAYIRRAVAWIVGSVCLALLGFFSVAFCNILFSGKGSVFVICVAAMMAILGPCGWWLAKVGTERLFFNEVQYYRRIIEAPQMLANETFDLEEISRLLTLAGVNSFETTEVCLFVLDKDVGVYRVSPPLKEDEPSDISRRTVLQRLLSAVKPLAPVGVESLEVRLPVVELLATASRPLLLSEIIRAEKEGSLNFNRYLTSTTPLGGTDMLLAPVRAQGRLVGVLILGERADRQQYAGPDFDIVQIILARFSSALETARVMLELRAAYEHQKELDSLKDQFIMTASHELRTPLTAVQGYIELLNDMWKNLEDEMKQSFLDKALRSCNELVLMVENIMDASRVQTDTEHIELSPVLLAASVKHVVEILEAVSTREHRTISMDIPGQIMVLADDMRLRQVLLNLASNAIKYSPLGTQVKITVKADDEQVMIRVRDQGMGVQPEFQERIFDRFVRLERDMNSPVRGAGLGLAISKQLVEAMRGRIWVESTGEESQGSTFVFTLQRSQATSNILALQGV